MRTGQSSQIVVLAALLVSCTPLGPLPGGELDGDLASNPPGDWSFSDSQTTIQLEVRPADPYSVNVWCIATNGSLYVAAGEASRRWARALIDDARARVRIGAGLYEVMAVRVTAVAEIQRYLDALSKKYPVSDAHLSDFQTDSDEPPSAVLFRLDPSPRAGGA